MSFRDLRTRVTWQLKDFHASWLYRQHCMLHRVELVLQTLSKMEVVSNVEDLQSMHVYFAYSPKRHIEFTKLASLMEKKGNKLIKQVKTRWISMLKPAKRVFAQYPILLYKMHFDSPSLTVVQNNLECLTNVKTVLGLACMLPLLEQLN